MLRENLIKMCYNEFKGMIKNKDNWLSPFTEEKHRELVQDICAEIQKSNIPDLKLIGFMRSLPSEYTFDILYNLPEKRFKELITLFESIYYGDFLKDIKEKDAKGISNFEKRYKAQSFKKSDKFLKTRLLTKHELEILAEAVCGDDIDLVQKPLFCYRNYKGNNQNLKILVEANKYLSTIKHANANFEILEKNTEQLLVALLEKLKTYNANLSV